MDLFAKNNYIYARKLYATTTTPPMITEYTQALAFADKELVEGLLPNDERIINYFFFKGCTPMFAYIIRNIFDYRANKDELINELYLYLQENDWEKLRKFQYRSKLTMWLKMTVMHFQKNKN